MRTTRQIALSIAIALLSTLAFSTGVARADTTTPSLAGESFYGGGFTSYHADCNPEGNSTITFTTQGTASGPYPGTFQETATVVLGPATGPLGPLLVPTAPVLSAELKFTIDSVVGQVSGSKTLMVRPEDAFTGACGTAPIESANDICESFFGQPGVSLTWQKGQGFATYEAVIRNASGSYRDSGIASWLFFTAEAQCRSGAVGMYAFSESFPLSNGVVPLETTGYAHGGGQLAHLEGGGGEDAVTFGFTAYNNTRDGILGSCNVNDDAADVHVVCDSVTSYSQSGRTATFAGTATVTDAAHPRGYGVTYRITVTDISESGIGTDSFAITTSTGYSVAGVLSQGDVQVCEQASSTTCGTPVL